MALLVMILRAISGLSDRPLITSSTVTPIGCPKGCSKSEERRWDGQEMGEDGKRGDGIEGHGR